MATLKVSDRVSDLGGYLKEQRENARLSVRQLASVAGVSNPYLSQIERGLRKPSAEVLQQIAKGLQISAEALFMRAGLLEESVGLEVEVAIQSDVHLTARQKRVLLDIYQTFRDENAREGVKSAPGEADGPGADARSLGVQGSDDRGSGRGEARAAAAAKRASTRAAKAAAKKTAATRTAATKTAAAKAAATKTAATKSVTTTAVAKKAAKRSPRRATKRVPAAE